MELNEGSEPGEDPESILRPLRAAGAAVEQLRAGGVAGAEGRAAVVQVAFAIEGTLRRLLRDDPAAALPVRLRALAPDELRAEEVLSELRQHDRVSIELAALVHELLGARADLREGRSAQPAHATLALQTAERLEREVLEAPALSDEAVPMLEPSGAPGEVWDDATLHQRPERQPIPVSGWVAGLLGVLLVLGLAVWWNTRPDDSQLQQGITLFRSGAYADAASHFFRYAQQNPDEVTPHLYLARIHRRMRRPDLAASELRRAMELAPGDPAVHQELGFLLLDTGRPDVAVERFRAALRLDPDAAESWVGLVRALHADGRSDAAERVLGEAPAEVRALLSSQPRSGAAAGASRR